MRGGERHGYSWRALPAADAGAAGGGGARGARAAPAVLQLRFALELGGGGADGAHSHSAGAWSQPINVDFAGARCVLLRGSDAAADDEPGGDGALSGAAGAYGSSLNELGAAGGDGAVPLWVVVSRRGLRTRVRLRGGYEVVSRLPFGVDVHWELVTTQRADAILRLAAS